MSLKKLSSSLDDAKKQITDLTDKIIERSKVFERIAKSPMGAYLDTLTAVLKDLNDPAKTKDRARLAQSLVQFQQLLQMMFPDFSVSNYERGFREANKPAPRPRQMVPNAPQGGNGNSTVTIGIVNGVLSVVNGGGGGTNLSPDDLAHLQSTGQLGGGH